MLISRESTLTSTSVSQPSTALTDNLKRARNPRNLDAAWKKRGIYGVPRTIMARALDDIEARNQEDSAQFAAMCTASVELLRTSSEELIPSLINGNFSKDYRRSPSLAEELDRLWSRAQGDGPTKPHQPFVYYLALVDQEGDGSTIQAIRQICGLALRYTQELKGNEPDYKDVTK